MKLLKTETNSLWSEATLTHIKSGDDPHFLGVFVVQPETHGYDGSMAPEGYTVRVRWDDEVKAAAGFTFIISHSLTDVVKFLTEQA